MSDRIASTSSARVILPLGVLVVMLVVVLASPASAATQGSVSSPTPRTSRVADSPDAVDMLRRMVSGSAAVTYHGTQFVTIWDEGGTKAVIAEVSHSPGAGTTYRLVGGSKASVLHDGLDGPAVVELLLDGYEVTAAGYGSVAGRSAKIIDVTRPDGSPAARLWVDREACLLLRRQVYAPDGALTLTSSFLDVTVAQGWSTGDPTAETAKEPADASVPSNGPDVPETIADGLTLYDVRTVNVGEQEATHLLYTDGLSAVSVFYQEGRLDNRRLDDFESRRLGGAPVHVKPGPPAKVTWSADGYVFTVVGDVTWATMGEIVSDLPHRAPADNSVVARVGRGVERVSSWLNPFE